MAMNAETRIGDLKLEVNKLPAMQAVMLSARIAKIVGPAIAAGFSGGFLNANVESVAKTLFDRLEPKELPGLLRELFAATLLNGAPANDVFDVVFADKLESIIPVTKYVLGFQFGNFGRALLAAGGAAMKQAVPESDSTSTKS